MTVNLEDLLRKELADAGTGWNMGGFGAIAEFHQDPGEQPEVDAGDRLERATTRGGIRIAVDQLPEITAIAYEHISPRPHRWTHGVALCLPEDSAPMHHRAELTELGPDAEALREEDRSAILFDMGLGVQQCDFCIRTSDPDLLAVLREQEGRSLFEADNPSMGAILKAHPHRIALTAIGRVEVYQKIGGPETGGVSPPGPHTHVLPKLLRTGRTHAANLPVPEGLIPCGALHPANPVITPLGDDRRFDRAAHDAFQGWLSRFGHVDVVAGKRRVVDAVHNDSAPDAFPEPPSRAERSGLRVALRQMQRIAEVAGDEVLLSRLSAWRAVHDRNQDLTEFEDDVPEHQ